MDSRAVNFAHQLKRPTLYKLFAKSHQLPLYGHQCLSKIRPDRSFVFPYRTT